MHYIEMAHSCGNGKEVKNTDMARIRFRSDGTNGQDHAIA